MSDLIDKKKEKMSIRAIAFVALQYSLPKYWLTALVYRLTRIRRKAFKDFLIRTFTRFYDVNIEEADRGVPGGYETFNDFFTRELARGCRPVEQSLSSVVSPVDGTLSASGAIKEAQIFQAKGRSYHLHDLLATNLEQANRFINGSFATIYLAPYNYHRVHAPLDAHLSAARYVPGDLFSVNAATVSGVRNLFARNERLICHFETSSGPMALIFVGALNVGSITTPWTGEIRPRKSGVVEELALRSSVSRNLRKGDLLGWFNMGSTVIVLFPPGSCVGLDQLERGKTLLMGEMIAELAGEKAVTK
jgi:phosphatidylserine decarboxylase